MSRIQNKKKILFKSDIAPHTTIQSVYITHVMELVAIGRVKGRTTNRSNRSTALIDVFLCTAFVVDCLVFTLDASSNSVAKQWRNGQTETKKILFV